MHLPSTFATLHALSKDVPVRVAMLGRFGLTWPWESMHIEALAWFDHFMKGRDTGIMSGLPIRYVVPGDPQQVWREAASWPPPEAAPMTLALRADGVLTPEEGAAGGRTYVALPPWMAGTAEGLPTTLTWETAPLEHDVILAGSVKLTLDAAISGGDTAFIVALQDVAPEGAIQEVTAGWRRAAVNEELTAFEWVPANEPRTYRMHLVDNARRFAAGHRIRLFLRADDTTGPAPIMGFKHAPIGVASHNTIASSSRLTLDVIPS
jgi:putative CocE/NonD family hydrolase